MNYKKLKIDCSLPEYGRSFWDFMRGDQLAEQKMTGGHVVDTAAYAMPDVVNGKYENAIAPESVMRRIASVLAQYSGSSHILAAASDDVAEFVPEAGSINVQDAVDDFTKIMKSIKIPGFAIDSILDGIANTIMTLRIGYVTRSYLKKGAKELKGVKGAYVRKDAMISALKNFPVLLAEIPQRVGTGAWSKVIELLTKIYKVEEETVADTSKKENVKPKKKGFFHFFR